MSTDKIVSAIVFGAGVISLITTFVLYRKKTNNLKRFLQANGVVTGLTRSQVNAFTSGSMNDDTIFREEENIFKGDSLAPVIEYADKSGGTYQIKGIGSSSPKYKIGQQVRVLYREDKPEKAIIDSFMEKWSVILMVGVFGAIIFLTGLLLLVFLK